MKEHEPTLRGSSNHSVEMRVWRLRLSLWMPRCLFGPACTTFKINTDKTNASNFSNGWKVVEAVWNKQLLGKKNRLKQRLREEQMLRQVVIHSQRLAMMQQTNGAWRKIGSKQLMQQSRKITSDWCNMCNRLHETVRFHGVMSTGWVIKHAKWGTRPYSYWNTARHLTQWFTVTPWMLWGSMETFDVEDYRITSQVTFDLFATNHN